MKTTSLQQFKPLPPSTMQIIEQLAIKENQSFQEILFNSQYSENNVNKRLKELRKKKYIISTKKGTIVYYSLSETGKKILEKIHSNKS